jgi:membrane protein
MTLVLVTLVLVFVGGRFADAVAGFLGLGEGATRIWGLARWPLAVLMAMVVFALIYYITPDVRHRGFHWITPGAVIGVTAWLVVSIAFGQYLSHFADFSAVYGAFAGLIVLVAWLWLTGVALLFGAEINAEIEREKQLSDGVPHAETLRRMD